MPSELVFGVTKFTNAKYN